MNIKLQLGEVRLLIDKRFPIEQISHQLQPLAKQSNLIFAEHQVGAGYLQWGLSGSDWTAFPNGSDEQKAIVVQIYKERKAQMQSFLHGSFLRDVIFSVPSEDFIFFRQVGSNWEIALTAWGYKYPDKPASGELDIWVSKQDLQKVNIAFSRADQILPEISFKLSGHMRTTSSDGFMHVDGQLPVGSSYSVETLMGHSYTLIVEKGKSDYIFDLTQYVQVEIAVYQDQAPLPNCECEINFDSCHKSQITNQFGHAMVRLPLLNSSLGELVTPQPPCVVTCGNEKQQQVPSREGEVLSFVFHLKSEFPKPPTDVSASPDRHVQVKVEVYRDKEPIVGQTSELLFRGDSHIIKTNERGEAFFDIFLERKKTGGLSGTRPICEVICNGSRQSKNIHEDTKDLLFHFDLPNIENPTKESEYVYIQLKDYAGKPLSDMPFNITLKKKGCQQLRTDNEGKYKFLKEWFTPKEKMKIAFVVSPEYQQKHDIHYKKNKRK